MSNNHKRRSDVGIVFGSYDGLPGMALCPAGLAVYLRSTASTTQCMAGGGTLRPSDAFLARSLQCLPLRRRNGLANVLHGNADLAFAGVERVPRGSVGRGNRRERPAHRGHLGTLRRFVGIGASRGEVDVIL